MSLSVRSFVTGVFWAISSVGAIAQTAPIPASLVADSVKVTPDQSLHAEGNVEILYDGTRLRAQSVLYDATKDRLRLTGPIYLLEKDGTVIEARAADLSADLRDGVLTSARLVYANELQVAAAAITRSEGRYTTLHKTAASSCKICANDPTPLWEIRAARIVHDSEERQLYFSDASLRVMDVPVFYLPTLRLPDPSVQRATGFLVPELRSNGDIGVGLRVPYFFALSDHSDLTIAPWITSKGAFTLEGRYRQKFTFGEIEINSAITDDDLTDENLRGYVFADGTFALPAGFNGSFDIEVTSDPGYLLLYGYSDKDRLDSAISAERVSREELSWAELIHYRSLRDDESNSTVPTIIADATYTRRFAPRGIGGTARLTGEVSGHMRTASQDPTNQGLARDVARLSFVADWRRDWVLRNGMILAAETELRADAYGINQDDRTMFGSTTEVTPYAAVEWRWPMMMTTPGARHLLEPVVQFVWSVDDAKDVDNEDSLLVEFDEGNLFDLSRFPGADARERGARANVGLTYTRYDPDGWDLSLTVGRVLRARDLGQFSTSTGLTGKRSDWLVAAHLSLGERLDVINRAVFDDHFSFARNETRVKWSSDALTLGSSFVWLEADTEEDRLLDTSEFTFDGALRVSRHWTMLSDLRYDFVSDRTTRAGLGFRYQNECARVDISVSRRFTSSTNVSPTTDLNLSVQLANFGGRSERRSSYTRQCNI